MDKRELDDILDAHRRWLNDEAGGKRADLRYADLRYADLSCAHLSNADLRNAHLSCADLSYADLSNADLSNAHLSYAHLSCADLSYADLSNAHLSNAHLSCADLSYADLSYADLSCAHLSYAHLRNADLSNADLSNADLSYADLSYAQNIPPLVEAVTSILPAGEIIGWKIAHVALVKLLIPADARRSNATGRKCRCDKATVLSITKYGKEVESSISDHDADLVYRVGETVEPDSFDEDRWDECSNGIHFFITPEEAVDYAG